MTKSHWIKDQHGNFSNNKKDTFDPQKGYIGIRLQQNVPLLDRDWNEMEDLRRYQEILLRREYIGNGTPNDGFRISALATPANDFVISHGSYLVEGFDVVLPPPATSDPLKYSDQSGVPPLTVPAQTNRTDTVYLDVWIEEVTEDQDPSLGNPDDVEMETCIRHKLTWCVRVAEGSANYDHQDHHHSVDLATLIRPQDKIEIEDTDIVDLRRTDLSLKKLKDIIDLLAVNANGDGQHTHSQLTTPDGLQPHVLQVDENGHIGIGTGTPRILGESPNERVLTISATNDEGGIKAPATLELQGADDGDPDGTIGKIDFINNTDSGTNHHMARIEVVREDEDVDQPNFAALKVHTRGWGTLREQIVINKYGRIGIGTTPEHYKVEIGQAKNDDNFVRISANRRAGLLFSDGVGSHQAIIDYHHPEKTLHIGASRIGIGVSEEPVEDPDTKFEVKGQGDLDSHKRQMLLRDTDKDQENQRGLILGFQNKTANRSDGFIQTMPDTGGGYSSNLLLQPKGGNVRIGSPASMIGKVNISGDNNSSTLHLENNKTGLSINTHGDTGAKTGMAATASGDDGGKVGLSAWAVGTREGKWGVYARAIGDDGAKYGVNATAEGINGTKIALVGAASGDNDDKFGAHLAVSGDEGNKYGVYVQTEGENGTKYGVLTRVSGAESEKFGLKAEVSGNGGTKYGVHATASGTGTNYAGHFDGDVHVVGTLSKGTGSFLIDHPKDPLNKTLRHNFVESPENLCLYRGKVKLNSKGEATVKMPGYFAALTKEDEATVSLTAIGKKPFSTSYQWNKTCTSFKIYGEKNAEVAYTVLADRDDPVSHHFAKPVEQDKGDGNFETGKYLYPEAFGQSKEMGSFARLELETAKEIVVPDSIDPPAIHQIPQMPGSEIPDDFVDENE